MSAFNKMSPATKAVRKKSPHTARILLVDDDERNLLALSEVLKGLADIVTATSGAEALRHQIGRASWRERV